MLNEPTAARASAGDTTVALPPLGLSTCRLPALPQALSLIETAWTQGIRLFATTVADDGYAQTVLGQWSTHSGNVPTVVLPAGLLEGILYHQALEREHQGRPYPEALRLREGLGYCIHPEFLQDYLEQSHQRLQHHARSVLLLQQPEQFLEWALAQGLPREEAHHELLRRLEHAFAFLEEQCRLGRLDAYGIQSEELSAQSSTNVLALLPEILELAHSVGGPDHHCRLLAVPFNLFEPAAATEPLIGEQTLLEYAHRAGLHVVVYRPLTAQLSRRPVLIAEPPVEKATLVSVEHIRGQLRQFLHTETEFLRRLTELPLNGTQREMVREALTLSLFLQDHWHEFASYEDWLRVKTGYLGERFRSLQLLVEPFVQLPEIGEQWQSYAERFQQVLTDIGRLYAARAWERARRLRTLLEEVLSIPIPPVPLAQLALSLVRCTEGVGSILVSSTSAQHIAENLASLELTLPTLRRSQWLALQAAQKVLQQGF